MFKFIKEIKVKCKFKHGKNKFKRIVWENLEVFLWPLTINFNLRINDNKYVISFRGICFFLF